MTKPPTWEISTPWLFQARQFPLWKGPLVLAPPSRAEATDIQARRPRCATDAVARQEPQEKQEAKNAKMRKAFLPVKKQGLNL